MVENRWAGADTLVNDFMWAIIEWLLVPGLVQGVGPGIGILIVLVEKLDFSS